MKQLFNVLAHHLAQSGRASDIIVQAAYLARIQPAQPFVFAEKQCLGLVSEPAGQGRFSRCDFSADHVQGWDIGFHSRLLFSLGIPKKQPKKNRLEGGFLATAKQALSHHCLNGANNRGSLCVEKFHGFQDRIFNHFRQSMTAKLAAEYNM